MDGGDAAGGDVRRRRWTRRTTSSARATSTGTARSDILWRHTTAGRRVDLADERRDAAEPGLRGHGGPGLRGARASATWTATGRPTSCGTARPGDVWVWLMNGTTRLSQTYVGTVADTTYQIQQVADFDGNGKADLLWWNTVRGDVWIWPMNGADACCRRPTSARCRTRTTASSGAGDYDGDGKADILWRHATQGDVWVWLMNGTARRVGDLRRHRCRTRGIRSSSEVDSDQEPARHSDDAGPLFSLVRALGPREREDSSAFTRLSLALRVSPAPRARFSPRQALAPAPVPRYGPGEPGTTTSACCACLRAVHDGRRSRVDDVCPCAQPPSRAVSL